MNNNTLLEKQTLDQLHSNHLWIEKTWLHARELVYYMNADIEHMVKQCFICLAYWQIQPQEKALHYEMPSRHFIVVGVDVFMSNIKTLLHIIDYHSKFPNSKESKELLSR